MFNNCEQAVTLAMASTSSNRDALALPTWFCVCWELLNRDNITCEIILYNPPEMGGDGRDALDKSYRFLSEDLSRSTSKIVLLVMFHSLVKSMYSLLTEFHHVFVDDYQHLINIIRILSAESDEQNFTDNILTEGLLSIAKNSDTNSTSLWVLCDRAQSWDETFYRQFRQQSAVTDMLDNFRHQFNKSKVLSINLRNSHEISAVLSIIRKYYKKIDFLGVCSTALLPQNFGHFLRGTKPVIHLISDSLTAIWMGILSDELEKLRGSDSSLQY